MTRKYSSAPLGSGSILGTTTPAETPFPQNSESGNDSFLRKVGGSVNSKASLTTVGAFAALFAANSVASTIGFSQSNYSVSENSRLAKITVERTDCGFSDSQASVSYETSNASATSGTSGSGDYNAVSGTLSWGASGDCSSRSFEVPIIDDAKPEANETVALILKAPTGGAKLGISSAVLTIQNDDDAPPKLPPVAQMFVNPKTGTAPLSVNLNSRSSDSDGRIEKCEWQVPGKPEVSGCDTQMTFDSAGTYNITLKVTDNDGLSATATDSVSVDAPAKIPPVAQMSVNPKRGTAPVTVNLNSSSSDSDGRIEKCEWQVPGKPSVSGCDTPMTFDSAGTYNITLKVTDNDGLTATATDSVSVEAPAKIPPIAQMSVNPKTGTAPLTVNLSSSSKDSDGQIEKCEWQVPGKPSVSGCNTPMTFDSAGTYNITLKVTDNDGLSATATDSVSVEAPAKIPPVAQMSVTPKTGIAPVTVNLNSRSSDSDGRIEKCEWQVPGKSSVSGCDTQMTFDNAGTYNITLKVTDNDGLTATATDSVIVEAQAIPPVAKMSVNPKTGTAPVTVNLNSSSSDSDGRIEKCEWQVFGKPSVSGCNTSMTFGNAGTYHITLEVTDNDGLTATATDSVSVEAQAIPPVAQMSVNPKTGTAPVTVNLNSRSYDSDGQIEKCEWQVPGKPSVSGCNTPMTFDSAGTYQITLKVTDNDGLTATATDSVKVESPQPPVAQLSVNPKRGTAPLTVNLNSRSYDSDGQIEKCEWQVPGKPSVSSCNTQMTFDNAGTYNITLKVTDNDGLTATATDSVNVISKNTRPTAAFVVTPTEGESPLTVTLNGSQSFDTDGSIVQYAWTASDGQSRVGESAQMTFEEPGTYTISLVVTDDKDDNSSNTANKTVTVVQTEVRPIARLIALPMAGEAPLKVGLEGGESYDPDGNVVSYEWIASDGQRADSQHAEMTFNTPGDYKIALIVTDNDGLQSTEAWRTIKVTEGGGTPPVAIFEELPASVQASLNVDLNASGSYDPDGKIVSYAWTASNGQTTLTASGSNTSLKFEQVGNYTVMLTVTDDENLKDTTSQNLIIGTDKNVDAVRVEIAGLNESYAIGETVIVDLVEKVNTNRFNRVDLWVAIQIPAGQLLFFTPVPLARFSQVPQPFKESLESTSKTTRLLDFEVIPGLGGTYTFYAVYVKDGSDPLTEGLEATQRSNLANQTTTLASE